MNKKLFYLTILFLLFFSEPSWASDMAGVALFFITIANYTIIFISLVLLLFAPNKVAIYIISILDVIFFILFSIALSHDWDRYDDISMMNTVYIQGVVQTTVTLFQFIRYRRKTKLKAKERQNNRDRRG